MSATETDARGRVITFYSYKGGTGRTMALANVAWLLAGNGYRVLAIDWDLESPGLHRYFHPFLRDKDQRYSEGILDLVRKYAAGTLQSKGDKHLRDVTSIHEYAVSIDWDFPRVARSTSSAPDARTMGTPLR
jgi:cellulose biosynthesis protein BcsQ